MKKPLRHFVINTIALTLLTLILPGVSYSSNVLVLLTAALIFCLVNLVVKLILKIIFLPINLLTFGLAGWLIQVILLYLTTLLVSGFSISSYDIGPAVLLGIAIPKIYFSGIWSYIGSSFVLSFLSNLLYWM